jgi:hypothetical protein
VVRPGRAPCDARAALSWDLGALRGRVPSRRDGHGFRRPARRFDALRATAGTGRRADCSARRPPCAFRFPSEVHRSTPAPSRIPEGILDGRCFLPWAFSPHDTCRVVGPSPRGVRPRGEPREVWVPPSRPKPPILREPCGPRASTGFTLQGFLLAPVGPPLGSPCPPVVSRVESPRPSGACGHGRLQGLDPGGELVPSVGPSRARRVDAFLGFVPPERSPPPSSRALSVRARSLITRWTGTTSRPACVSRCCGAEGSACPSRGRRLSWDSSPCDRRGAARAVAEGGLMVSPHGSRRVRASNRFMPSRERPEPGDEARPDAAVLR